MTKEKSLMIVKIVLPILIVTIIGGIWFVKNKPSDNSDTAVQTSTVTTLNDDSANKGDSVNPEDKATTSAANIVTDTKDDTVIEKSELGNKDSIKNTENTTIKISEETNNTLNNEEKPSNIEVSVAKGKVETPIDTAKKTEAPISTAKPATSNSDFDLAATTIDLAKLKSYGLPIIIDFGADSCIPCKEMAPVLKKLNAELQGKVIVKFVDVWKYKEAAENFPVEVIPTQFFFDKDGKPYVPSDPDKMGMKMYTTKDINKHVYTSHQGGLTEQQIREVLKEMGVK